MSASPQLHWALALGRLFHGNGKAGPRSRPTKWSAFPLEATFGIVIGWLCAAVAVIGLPSLEAGAVFRSLVFVAGAILFGIPMVWRQRYLQARLRFAETEGLYERLDDAAAGDLHEAFLLLCQTQRALNQITRPYNIKKHDLWVAQELQQPATVGAIAAEMRALESNLALEARSYDWETLSALHRLEKAGYTPSPELAARINVAPTTASEIDEQADVLHKIIVEVGPRAW